MFNIVYTVQRPGEGPAVLAAYRHMASKVPFDRVTGLFAFASAKGARLLCRALREACGRWDSVTKRWVISIDGGITDPEALRFLLRIKRTEVRVPDAEGLLARRLKPIHRFHPKTMLFESGAQARRATGLVVGSANLTCNGLCFGHEHVLAADLAYRGNDASIATGIDDLTLVYESATRIDEGFIDRYQAIRPTSPSLEVEFEDKRTDMILQEQSVIPELEAASLASANNLWVEVLKESKNRGPNQEGSQIDLKKGTRVFFGFGDHALPKNSPIGTIQILFHDHSALRNLRFGKNGMDKLDLPIPGREGPPSYGNQTLLFTRQPDGAFRMTVGSAAQIAEWKHRSNKLGASFRLQGGRAYGVF